MELWFDQDDTIQKFPENIIFVSIIGGGNLA